MVIAKHLTFSMAKIFANKCIINLNILFTVISFVAYVRADCEKLPDLSVECNHQLAKRLAAAYVKIDQPDNALCIYSVLPNKEDDLKYIIEKAYDGKLEKVNATMNFVDVLENKDQLAAAGYLQDAMGSQNQRDPDLMFRVAAKFKWLLENAGFTGATYDEASRRWNLYHQSVRYFDGCEKLPDLNVECNRQLAKRLAAAYVKIEQVENALCVYSALPNKEDDLKYIIEKAYDGKLENVNITMNFVDVLENEDQLAAAGYLQDAMEAQNQRDTDLVFKVAAKFKWLLEYAGFRHATYNEAYRRWHMYHKSIRYILDCTNDVGTCLKNLHYNEELFSGEVKNRELSDGRAGYWWVFTNYKQIITVDDYVGVWLFHYNYVTNSFFIRVIYPWSQPSLWLPGIDHFMNDYERYALTAEKRKTLYDWKVKPVRNQTAIAIQNGVLHEYLQPSTTPRKGIVDNLRYVTTWIDPTNDGSHPRFHFEVFKCDRGLAIAHDSYNR